MKRLVVITLFLVLSLSVVRRNSFAAVDWDHFVYNPEYCRLLLTGLPIEAEKTEIRFIKGQSSSLLFFFGDFPTKAERERAYRAARVEYVRNEDTGIVAIVSRNGLMHTTMTRYMPKGSLLLGGTRYYWGKPSDRKNSEHFPAPRGDLFEERYFKVIFE